MMIPGDLQYTKEHEWVRIEGDIAVIGITDHAQSQLGDITFVELPQSGTGVAASESLATVESVKAASDVYAPVSGEVTEVNSLLEDQPESINSSPYEKGWICKLKIEDRSQLEDLMSAPEYEELIKE